MQQHYIPTEAERAAAKRTIANLIAAQEIDRKIAADKAAAEAKHAATIAASRIYISYFDGNDSRRIATSKSEAISQLMHNDGGSDEPYSYLGYDEITDVIYLDASGEVLATERIDLSGEAEDEANRLNAEVAADCENERRERSYHMHCHAGV